MNCRLIHSASCILACLVLSLSCTKASDPTGIYLAEGGTWCVVISKEPESGSLQIQQYNVIPGYRIRVSLQGRKMKIEQCLFVDGAGNESTIDYELSPSDKMKGDWDLTNFNYKTIDNPMNALKKKLGFYRMCTHSYLHRINDTLIVEYYKLKKESDYANALLIAEKLITDNPDDHHVRILYLRALMDVKEVTKLEERLSLWEQELINSHFPYISDNVLTCRNILRALKYSQKGKNASDLAVVIFKPETDLEQRLKQFPGFLKYDVFLMPYNENPHFFDMQMTLKAFRAKSYFMMLSGEKEKSLRLLTTMYHLSRLINTGNRESMFFIGSGFRQIAVDGLLLYSINCCETEEDMYLFWEYLKKIEHSPAESFIPTHAEYMRESKSGELKKFVEKHEKEAQERSKSADAKFYLVQMATAAKRCLIINGHFPKTYEDYKPFLTNGPPTDPFHNGPLSSIIEDDKMICYSRGPNDKDEKGKGDDIAIEIPRERKYPFPRDGVKASTKEQLLAQFPNGLPPDPFERDTPLQVSDSTPVYIYSIGPDREGGDDILSEGGTYIPTVQYDPTNGTISAGDIFVMVPSE